MRHRIWSGYWFLFMFAGNARAAAEPSMQASQLARVVIALIVMLIVIFSLSALVRKLNVVRWNTNGVIKIIGGVSLGGRERLILIQVGEEQILVSAGQGGVNRVHKLNKPLTMESSRKSGAAEKSRFADILSSVTRSIPR